MRGNLGSLRRNGCRKGETEGRGEDFRDVGVLGIRGALVEGMRRWYPEGGDVGSSK